MFLVEADRKANWKSVSYVGFKPTALFVLFVTAVSLVNSHNYFERFVHVFFY